MTDKSLHHIAKLRYAGEWVGVTKSIIIVVKFSSKERPAWSGGKVALVLHQMSQEVSGENPEPDPATQNQLRGRKISIASAPRMPMKKD